MSDEQTNQAAVDKATEEFDVLDWLNDAINAEGSVTVYKNATLLLELDQLSELAREAADKSKKAEQAGLSIVDEYDEAAQEALAAAEAVREQLLPYGVTFHLRSIGNKARDTLVEKVARELKAKPATDDEPAVPGGREHPDFFPRFQHQLLSKSIVKVTTPDGRESTAAWSPERVEALRKLPGNEWNRLWNKLDGLTFAQYDIDRALDLDFS